VSTGSPGGRLVLECRLEQGIPVVRVGGEVDVSTSGELRSSLLAAVSTKASQSLVVNLADVQFIDSTGIGVLVGLWRRIRAGNGRLVLAAPSSQVRRTLDTAGLTEVLPCYELESEAVHGASPHLER
jgi:anti-sigma B factor antagonist